ncbi:hypothetical protein [Nocardia lijiangensis]|uniref:hypothetical protein n=1 Tax=Nocardia lijiangensis TaxID=299618 RepID=UPI00083054B2|nr:hypothetical protein [Nocardia lijiangensis]
MVRFFRRKDQLDNACRVRFANLCRTFEQWPETENLLSDAGAGPALRRIRELLPDTPIDSAEARELLDAVDRAGLVIGLEGVTTGTKGYRPLPAGFEQRTDITAWVCPFQCCDKAVLPGESEAVPRCALGPAGTAMVEFTVDS